jgi:hypothetical protein
MRELHAHLEECYQVPVSPDSISASTEEIPAGDGGVRDILIAIIAMG